MTWTFISGWLRWAPCSF